MTRADIQFSFGKEPVRILPPFLSSTLSRLFISKPRASGRPREATDISLWKRVLSGIVGLTISTLAVAAETGGLRISVVDTAGKPVSGAAIALTSPDSLVKTNAVTDEDGGVRLLGLDPATNYTIEIMATGFDSFSKSGVAVVSGRSLSLRYVLAAAAAAETETQLDSITVTGRSLAALDTTSSSIGLDITLDLTESLPTGRNYQSYLQLVPGTKPSASGNPGSKSGVNYSDIGGVYGTSTDNVYYIDGINVTDPLTGTFGSNLNSEIIQEQQALTSGAPAEYEGGAGLISRVVTKSGGDEFHGSVNYYFQNDGLVARNEHLNASGFSTYDTAFTLGGPVLKEKLWFFTSYQLKDRDDDVSDPTTGAFQRSVSTEQDLAFAKGTWQITDSDRVSLLYFNDPFERSGSLDPTVVNNRDLLREQGGDNYRLDYSHAWHALGLIAGGYIYAHEGELSNLAANDQTRNDVAFLTGTPTNADLQLGGYGQDVVTFRNRDEFGVNLQYLLTTEFGEHAIKGGLVRSENEYQFDLTYSGPEAAQYNSIASGDSGVSYDDYVNQVWEGEVGLVDDDRQRIIDAVDASTGADRTAYFAELDTDNSNTIELTEVSAMLFDSAAGNPNGQVNAYRIVMTQSAPVTYKSEGTTFFLQDSWTLNQWTVNAGVRTERWEHFATDGSSIFTFDWEIAPRLSVVYDVNGDGRSKLWGFAGRYYDPIRNDMTQFAGTLTGPIRDEQVFVGDRWLTFRTRGGAQVQDAYFAPTTKTPYTDELLLGYALTVGEDSTITLTYTNRVTEDILEDYDLTLYSDPAGPLAGTVFFLPYEYFGYSAAPNSNYVIGTLAGGKREYKGYEISYTKQRSNNWQALGSYTYNDAKGNSNSDGNADFQGDVVWLDPRAPGMYGDQPGSIKHQIKLAGSYFWDMGWEVGGIFNLNSGVIHSKTFAASGRNLPVRVTAAEAYEYGGTTQRWVDEDSVGTYSGPAFATIDMRVKYTHKLPVGKTEVFLDIFNLLDDQSATGEQDLAAGDGVYEFGEANAWVEPRRLYLGARYSF